MKPGFWNRVPERPVGCWEWRGHRERTGKMAGYGRWHSRMAHRVAYELTKGLVPDGLELDHLCRNRSCVNPDHLEPVTHLENIRRARRTVCQRGHPFDEANTMFVRRGDGSGRQCRACKQARDRERYRTALRDVEPWVRAEWERRDPVMAVD